MSGKWSRLSPRWQALAGVVAVAAMVGGLKLCTLATYGTGAARTPGISPGGLSAREAAPVDAPPAGDDEEANALKAALHAAGVEAPLLLFFARGGHNIFGLATDGSAAVDLWEKLRGLTEQTGYYPVILGDGSSLPGQPGSAVPGSPQPTLAEAARIDVPTYLEARGRRWAGDIGAPHGAWPVVPSALEAHYAIPTDILTGRPLAHVAIALVPTRSAWEVPAWLGFGGSNDCPMPAEQVAVMKHWNERYGAEIVGMSGDVVEMRVARPPTSREDAMALAREQYAYDYDIVEQGTESLEALAATLADSHYWFFWWD